MYAPQQRAGGGQGLGATEMQMLLDRMKADILREVRTEIADLANLVRENNRTVNALAEKLDVKVGVKNQAQGALGAIVQNLCSGDKTGLVRRTMTGSAAEGTSPLTQQTSPAPQGPFKDPLPVEPQALSFAKTQPELLVTARPTVLGPTVAKFGTCINGAQRGPQGEIKEVPREALIAGLEAYAAQLDQLGGNMGSYISVNTKKLRASKADSTKPGYHEWLASELPTHAVNGYSGYVDDSGFMANLWLAWTMEFFVEFYAELCNGKDTKTAVDVAYKKSLYNHHNFFQRAGFNSGVSQLPARDGLIAKLQGGGSQQDIDADFNDFVRYGRPLVKFILQTNKDMDALMKEKKKGKR